MDRNIPMPKQSMSEKAKALEQACKDMDAAYITEKHKAVMEEYRDLIEKIKNAL